MAAPSTGWTVIANTTREPASPGKPTPTDWDLIPGARGCAYSLHVSGPLSRELQKPAQQFGPEHKPPLTGQKCPLRLHPLCSVDATTPCTSPAPSAPADFHGRWDATDQAADDLIAEGPMIDTVLYRFYAPRENASDVIAWLKADRLTATYQHRVFMPEQTNGRDPHPNVTENRNHTLYMFRSRISGCRTRS